MESQNDNISILTIKSLLKYILNFFVKKLIGAIFGQRIKRSSNFLSILVYHFFDFGIWIS